jgi:hypothetical protein
LRSFFLIFFFNFLLVNSFLMFTMVTPIHFSLL